MKVARFAALSFNGGSATVALDVHLHDGRVMYEAIDGSPARDQASTNGRFPPFPT
jgi:hypothetical protein